MKRIMLWMLTTILILSGLTTLTSCSNDDNGIVEPTGQVLQDGEWMVAWQVWQRVNGFF